MTNTIKDTVLNVKVGTLTAIFITLASFLVGLGIGYEKIQARLRHLDGKTELYAQRFDALEKRVDNNDIRFAEIQKDLASIESLILDIKQRLK